MKVTLLQRNIYWCDPSRNRIEIEHMLAESPDTDLIVMAEMFQTGFCMTPENIAERSDSNSVTVDWMKYLAKERQCALAGSMAVEELGNYYNRFYFVFPDGTVKHYDKRHLFTYGGESLAYTSGEERVVVQYKGVRILLQICYDLRFPVWTRNRDDYDIILYVANWPTSRIAVWETLLRARAIENQSYVVGVNRTGTDPLCSYCGHSMIIDAYGKDLLHLGEEEVLASSSVNLVTLQTFRKKFPVLEDKDVFKL